jgi:hypothetical protein
MITILRLYLAQYNWRKFALTIGTIAFLFSALLFVSWLTMPSVEYSEAKARLEAAQDVRRLAQDGFVEAGSRLADSYEVEAKALRELMLIRK